MPEFLGPEATYVLLGDAIKKKGRTSSIASKRFDARKKCVHKVLTQRYTVAGAHRGTQTSWVGCFNVCYAIQTSYYINIPTYLSKCTGIIFLIFHFWNTYYMSSTYSNVIMSQRLHVLLCPYLHTSYPNVPILCSNVNMEQQTIRSCIKFNFFMQRTLNRP